MALIVKKGTIAHLERATVNVMMNGSGRSQYSFSFRLDNTPAEYKAIHHVSLSDGDMVTAVGEVQKGMFMIKAMKNETTGAVMEMPPGGPLIVAILLAIVGIPLSLFLIGLPLLFKAGMLFYEAHTASKAQALLRSAV